MEPTGAGVFDPRRGVALLGLDRGEESLDVGAAKALCAAPLDHLEEEGRPPIERAGERLQERAGSVAVDQNVEIPQQV